MDYDAVNKAYKEYVDEVTSKLTPLKFEEWKSDARKYNIGNGKTETFTNEEWFQRLFEKQATFRGNGVYEFAGIFHKDTQKLAVKGIKLVYAHYVNDLSRGSLTRKQS
jgi:hypothetical protein